MTSNQPCIFSISIKQIDSEGIGKLMLQMLQDRFMALNLGESKTNANERSRSIEGWSTKSKIFFL